MLKMLSERLIRKQEKETGENAGFIRDIYASAPGGFARLKEAAAA